MKNFEKLNKNEMKMIFGGREMEMFEEGEAKCSGKCPSGQTCKVPHACTKCSCVDSSGWDRGACQS